MSFEVKQIRVLARRYTPEQIESCIGQQLDTGKNVCIRNDSTEKIICELAKAQFIREKMEAGLSLADALRDLARRMRILQETIKTEGSDAARGFP